MEILNMGDCCASRLQVVLWLALGTCFLFEMHDVLWFDDASLYRGLPEFCAIKREKCILTVCASRQARARVKCWCNYSQHKQFNDVALEKSLPPWGTTWTRKGVYGAKPFPSRWHDRHYYGDVWWRRLFVLGIEGAQTKETSTEWSSCWAEGAERRPEALLKLHTGDVTKLLRGDTRVHSVQHFQMSSWRKNTYYNYNHSCHIF